MTLDRLQYDATVDRAKYQNMMKLCFFLNIIDLKNILQYKVRSVNTNTI